MRIRHGDLLIRQAAPEDAEQLFVWWNDGSLMAHAGFPNGLGMTAEQIREQIVSPRGTGLHLILLQDVPIGEMNYRDAGDTPVTSASRSAMQFTRTRDWGKFS